MPKSDPVKEILGFDADSCIHASAGTGKTHILVEKYVHLLKEKKGERFVGLKNMLAITFTEKAAVEMRRRIYKRIMEEVRSLEAGDSNRENKKLIQHLKTSRRQMPQSYISTIHSFCARILRENPIEAGLDPQFEIADAKRTSVLQSKALGQFLLHKLQRGDSAVMELAYRYGYASGFSYQGSLTKVIGSLYPLLRAAGKMNSQKLLSEYENFLKDAKGTLTGLKAKASEILKCLEEAVTTEKGRDMVGELSKRVSRLSPSKDLRSEQMPNFLKSTIKLTNKSMIPKDARGDADNFKETLENYFGIVVSSLAYPNAERFKNLLDEFYAYMENSVKSRALLDFDDLQEKTLELFRRDDRIRDHYREQFRYLLVDEFQDVNGLQKEIIYQLATPGDGKLFLVGDPKQAIYGFRGGDLEVFEEAKREIEKNSGKNFSLNTNRRSTDALVEFVNAYFAQSCAAIFGEEDRCLAHREGKLAPAVERLSFSTEHLSADERRFKEAALIAGRIREMVNVSHVTVEGEEGERRPVRYGDIALLFRKFTQLPLYENALNGAGVPVVVHKGAGFYQSQEIADLVMLLSFIDNPSDIVSWIGALRSPYGGLSDTSLLHLRRGSKGKLIDHLDYMDESKAFDAIGDSLEREKFASFMKLARHAVSQKDRMAVSELIEMLLDKSRIIGITGAQQGGMQKVANLLKLIETARTMERKSTTNLKNFVRYLSGFMEDETGEPQAVVAAVGDDVVKIMTIHQSKGLEFPVVFVVDMDSPSTQKPSPVVFNPRRGIAATYVDKITLASHKGKVFTEISGLNKAKSLDDETRLFYVACTRACDRLVLSGGLMKSGSGRAANVALMLEGCPELFLKDAAGVEQLEPKRRTSSVYDALRVESNLLRKAPTFTDKPVAVKESGGDAFISVARFANFMHCPRRYIFQNFYRINPSPYSSKEKKKNRASPQEVGSAVHLVLESVDLSLGEKDYRRSVDVEIHKALPHIDSKARGVVAKRLYALHDMPLFKRVQNGEINVSGRELPFTARFGRDDRSYFINGKIDLLLRKGVEKVWVVDYKYSQVPDMTNQRRFQLELYGLAIATHLGIDAVTCALVFLKEKIPTVFEWELGKRKLGEIEKKMLDSAGEIMEWEEKGRQAGGAGLPDLDCPDSRCHYTGFCLGRD